MDDKIVSLNEKRAIEKNDNTLWTPLECVRAFVRDIENDEAKPTEVLIIFYEERPDGRRAIRQYSANLKYDATVAMLEAAKTRTIEEWFS